MGRPPPPPPAWVGQVKQAAVNLPRKTVDVNKMKATLDHYYNFEEKEDGAKLSVDDVKALLISGASLADRLRTALNQAGAIVKASK